MPKKHLVRAHDNYDSSLRVNDAVQYSVGTSFSVKCGPVEFDEETGASSYSHQFWTTPAVPYMLEEIVVRFTGNVANDGTDKETVFDLIIVEDVSDAEFILATFTVEHAWFTGPAFDINGHTSIFGTNNFQGISSASNNTYGVYPEANKGYMMAFEGSRYISRPLILKMTPSEGIGATVSAEYEVYICGRYI